MIYQGIMFIDHDRETYAGAKGIRTSVAGGLRMVSEERAIRQAIFILLSTMPGERVMRPEYGCDLFRLVFSPNDDTTAGLAMHYVRKALERWETRIAIVRIDASRSVNDPLPASGGVEVGVGTDQTENLYISIEYRILPSNQISQLIYPFNLQKEPSDVSDGSEP